MKSFGGNRIIPADALKNEVISTILDGVVDVYDWAELTGRQVDASSIHVECTKTNAGSISVLVECDPKEN